MGARQVFIVQLGRNLCIRLVSAREASVGLIMIERDRNPHPLVSFGSLKFCQARLSQEPVSSRGARPSDWRRA